MENILNIFTKKITKKLYFWKNHDEYNYYYSRLLKIVEELDIMKK